MDKYNKKRWVVVGVWLIAVVGGSSSGERCGRQGGGALCSDNQCCSQFGWCGTTMEYCNPNTCQSQCIGGVSDIISREAFELMLKHRDDSSCPARGFYVYDAFLEAAKSFPAFATTGDFDTRKREMAAFLAQTSHETSGGWAASPDGPYAWGYCFNKELHPATPFCVPSTQYPCAPGKLYYGRGPFLLSWNFNYGACGEAIGVDLLNHPDVVASDPVISFKTALWIWMTRRLPNVPSCHDIISGAWTPSAADMAAGRLPGYGATTNIINGGLECGRGGPDQRVEDRIGFYKRYCDILGVPYGPNLDCYSMKPFASSSLLHII